MAAQYNPKQLAKTIAYIACLAPAEHGLFWDPDGTMPWKELFWVLKEDPALRFVRESTLRELSCLGFELPFVLERNLLRLQPGLNQPFYPLAADVPERLFFACRRKQYAFLREHGIARSHRPYVAVSATKELACRLGKRRDPDPLLVEVLATRATTEGESIHWAGAELYLVKSIPVHYLIFPLIRADQHVTLAARKKVGAKSPRVDLPVATGSFFIDAQQFLTSSPAKDGIDKGGKQKGRKKGDWKREAKKERHKRSV
jgi:putative RNA 2'-phosphotransferase